jgi:hypothetical protein
LATTGFPIDDGCDGSTTRLLAASLFSEKFQMAQKKGRLGTSDKEVIG